MKTKIVVDSSSNLYTLSGVDFACVPLKIVTDDGEYLDTAAVKAYLGPKANSGPDPAQL